MTDYNLEVSESMGANDSNVWRNAKKTWADTTETWAELGHLARFSIGKEFSETLTTQDVPQKYVSVIKEDNILTVDQFIKELEIAKQEQTGIQDEVNKGISFEFSEQIESNDERSQTLEITKIEETKIKDVRKVCWNGILQIWRDIKLGISNYTCSKKANGFDLTWEEATMTWQQALFTWEGITSLVKPQTSYTGIGAVSTNYTGINKGDTTYNKVKKTGQCQE